MTARGIAYNLDGEYEVAEDEGKRLTTTFPDKFEAIVVEEPKKPRAKKPTKKTEE